MRKLLQLMLFTALFMAGYGVYAQDTCSQTFTVSGSDSDPTVLSVSSADINCNAGGAISEIVLNTTDNFSNTYCDNWYDYTLEVDESNGITGCASDFDGTDITGFSDLTITSSDLDFWSDSVTIEIELTVTYTPASCPSPSNIAVANVSSSSADLSWDASESVDGGYEYVVIPSDEGLETGTPVAEASTSVTITELDPNTDYDVYVRTVCGEETSAWSSAASFTTYGNCASTGSFTYTDDMNINNSLSSFVADTPGDYITLVFTAGSTESCCDDWFINDAADGTGETIASGSGSIVGEYESTTGEISFYVESDGSVQGTTFEYELSCTPPPSCIEPDNLSFSNITTSSVDLSWDASESSEGGYEYVVVPSGDGVETGASVAEASTSVTISELDPNTAYDAYVRTVCGEETSAWSSAASFTTYGNCASTGSFTYTDDMNINNSLSSFVADTPGDYITLVFTAGSTESCCDDWFINDAADGTGETIASGSGSIVGEYESTTGEISFYVESDGSVQGTTFEYELSCTPPPSCIEPDNLSFSNITTSSVDLSWDASTTEDGGYEYVIVPSGDDVETGTPVAETSTSVTVSELDSASDYDVYVRTICGEENSEWSSAESFTTACESYTNLSENFDSSTSMPNCWEAYDPSTGSAYVSDSQSSSGDNSFYIYNSNYYDAGLFTPELSNLGENYRFRFSAYSSSTSTKELEVVTVDAEGDFAEFTTVEISASSTWEEFSIDFSEYSGTDTRIAILHGQSTSYQSFYVDDVIWEENPSCLEPGSISVENITLDSADVSWGASSTEDGGYEYVIVPSGDGVETGTPVAETSASVTVSELDPNTNYDVYVRTVCGAETSEWSSAEGFSTPCEAFTVPFSENFDSSTEGSTSNSNAPDCWSFIDSGAGYAYVYNGSSNAQSGEQAFRLYNSFDSSGDYMLISPEIAELATEGAQVNFSVDGTSGQALEIGTITDPTDAETFTVLSTVTLATSDYEDVSVNINPGTDNYFAIRHGQTGTYYSFYIDDIEVNELPSCLAPENVSAEINYAESTLDLSWDASPTEDGGYEFIIVPSEESPDESMTLPVESTSFSGTLDEAPSSTTFDLYVRTICGEEVSAWAGPVSFTTPPSNDNACNAIALTVGDVPNGDDYSNIGASVQTDEPDDNLSAGAVASVWFTFEAPASGSVRLSTDYAGGTLDDTEVAVYSTNDCGDFTTFTQIGFNQDGGTVVDYNSILDLYDLTEGETYYVQVDQYSGEDEGTFGISVEDIGYIYENSTWTPEDPSGVASDYSRIIIKNGTGVITAETDAYDVVVEPEAVLSLQADLTSDVKFMSNATSTAQLADATGFSINGDVTVERYFPANRSFRFATSAVDSDASIYDNWQEGGETPTGYGTHITGSTDGSNGFDATETGNLSFYDYDNTTQAWTDVANTDVDNLAAGKPYRLYVRGDRTIDLTDNEAQGETVLRATGDLVIGDVVADGLGETANDFSFIGNPYQATVDASSITFDNVEPGFYWVWDPNMNADGSYVVVDLSDGSNAGTSQANQFLQPGQAAFVRTLADGPASVTFTEASKNVDEVSNAVFSDNNEPRLNLRLYESQTMQDGGMEFDAIGIRFKSNGNNAVDGQDAPKMGNPAENLARLHGNDFLTIENRELPQDGEELSLALYNYEHANYTFEADLSDFAENVTVYLNDNYTGEQTVLENGLNHVDFNVDSSIPESVSMTRFTFSFEVTTLGVSDEFDSAFSVYPNPVTNQAFTIQTSHLAGEDVDLKLFNISGQAVMSQNLKVNSNGALNVQTSQLSSGVYILELTQGKQSYKEKLIIK